jgi:cobalt-zinc-cadmium efflux system outer membrane protein
MTMLKAPICVRWGFRRKPGRKPLPRRAVAPFAGLAAAVLAAGLAAGFPAGMSPAQAAEASRPEPAVLPDEGATFSDYARYAVTHNAGLKAAFNDWKATREKIPQAHSWPDPRFTYTDYIRPVETRVGPQERSFSLVQTVPWPGKLLARGRVASREAESAYQRYEAARLALVYRLAKAYCEYYYLSRAISITENDVALVSDLEDVARTRYKVGAVPYAALIKAQVEIARLEDDLQDLREMRRPAAAALNEIMGRPRDAYVPWPEGVSFGSVEFGDSSTYRELGRNNPELLALRLSTSKEEAALGLARQQYFPDLILGATVIQTGPSSNPGLRDSGKDPVMASVSVGLPVWIGKYRAAEREARARRKAAADRRADRENQLAADLEAALFNLRSAERRIDLYGGELIPKAEQALAASRRAFSADQADFFDLIEAQRTLLEFRLVHERALSDRAQRIAEIDMLLGRDIRPESAGALDKTGPDSGPER